MRDELSLFQAQLTYKKRLEAMLAELKAQESPLLKKTAQLEQIMIREQKDVDRLEGHSLTALFYQMAGKMDKKLDLERREYYAAKAKYDTCLRELEAVQQDIEATEEDLEDLACCEQKYAEAMERKRLAIESAPTPEAHALLKQEQTLNYLTQQDRELREAITAGTEALRTTAEILQCIESAKDWAAFDILGGGLLADIAKHDKLEEAQQHVGQLQIQLQRFNKEISDVTIRANLQTSIDSMLRFADFFFDGLLADIAVLDKIKQSLTHVEHTREQILTVLRQLQDQLEDVHQKSIQTRKEIDTMVLQTDI